MTAWELIGWDDGRLRIKGGRATYDAVSYNDDTPGGNVRLQRLEPREAHLRVITRYVDPDTELEPADDMAREHWPQEKSASIWMVVRDSPLGGVTFGPFESRKAAEQFAAGNGNVYNDALNRRSRCGPWLP